MEKQFSHLSQSNSADLLIIGGGIMGLCTAYYAAKAGASVLSLEKDEIGSGATHGNAGLVVPSHIVPLAAPSIIGKGLRWMLDPESPFYIRPRWDLDLVRWLWAFRSYCTEAHVQAASKTLLELNVASARLYRELEDAGVIGEDCYTRKGLLYVYEQEANFQNGVEEAKHLEAEGFEMEVLDSKKVRERVPSASEDIAGGVHHVESAHVIPDRLMERLLRTVRDLGVEVHTGTKVTELVVEKGRVTSAKTEHGEFYGEQVVLASGALSPSLLKRIGVRIPLQPAKGYSLSVRLDGEMPPLPMILAEAYVAVTPMGDLLRFAGTLELTGVDYSISPRRIDGILKSIHRFLPGLGEWETVETWAGLRPCLPDGLPVIGKPKGIDNLTIAAGHAKIGILLGPITGRLTAQLAMGKEPEMDLKGVGLGRFG
ncbi:MAG: FAD-dependent oxidoreductase [Candidatus Omnitrophica bacterium]|nr:FAD-dependent oxidoreductase [Candidatus Omnitrophota bacterium]